ncbi:hypothetical protein WJX72_005637 [[Myrmecia] bisecta]|uniref:Uncharacterized protein n=1 Tax=[Myrmecia] bisecta TaxID=41462 RepID=A0AAW1QBH0_9CHLO
MAGHRKELLQTKHIGPTRYGNKKGEPRGAGGSISSLPAEAPSSAHAPDLQLSSDTGVPVFLYGVDHLDPQPYIGDFILQKRPAAVVVETAVSPVHGERAGNLATCKDQVPGPQGPFIRMMCQIAAQLAEAPDALNSPIWQAIQRQFAGEQLAYIAAFATAARVVYGDRPKEETYRRLAAAPTLVDLDQAFAVASMRNYKELVTDLPHVPADEQLTCVERIMLTERDAVLCNTIHAEAQRVADGHCVVAVVGRDHLAGIRQLWQQRTWEAILASSCVTPAAPQRRLLGFIDKDGESAAAVEAGVHRGLLEALMRLKCVPQVIEDMDRVLGPVPNDQREAYEGCLEVYGSPRMLMAVLSQEQLSHICRGLGMDYWDVLEPLRAVRPVNGGPGFSMDLVMQLRMLHFELG